MSKQLFKESTQENYLKKTKKEIEKMCEERPSFQAS
jgi:hypothetical protein